MRTSTASALGLARASKPRPPTADPVRVLLEYLFGEEGFAGAEQYYDPRNSYLNEVLARRRGIPITLSLVCMAVGRRAGLDVRGISFPGHFLVRCRTDVDRLVDPFHGRILQPGECEARLASALGRDVVLDPELHLRDATPREILVRMLTNLQQIFAGSGDAERLLACCDRIVLLTPRNPIALRDRSAVYQRLGWLVAAISDLETALEILPEGQHAKAVRGQRDALRQKVGRLN